LTAGVSCYRRDCSLLAFFLKTDVKVEDLNSDVYLREILILILEALLNNKLNKNAKHYRIGALQMQISD
jgi:hypothetical protein